MPMTKKEFLTLDLEERRKALSEQVLAFIKIGVICDDCPFDNRCSLECVKSQKERDDVILKDEREKWGEEEAEWLEKYTAPAKALYWEIYYSHIASLRKGNK
jgi:hypothetical protein